jgi:lipid II:glycine glycyltransferase (peptidoglycan interpeptide bridge formation enzyme)
MIQLKKHFKFFTVTEVWFTYKFSFTQLLGLRAYLHIKNNTSKIWGIQQHSYTVENVLLPNAEAIFDGFSKTVKVEIKQAEKMNVNCFFHKDISSFVEFYNAFAIDRKIETTSPDILQKMNEYLHLSYAVSNNVILAAHSYLVDSETGTARLVHSASQRLNKTIDKQLAGRANKLLHYKDMLHFKANGFITYDFGGFANNTSDIGLQGINTFKLSFGGQKVVCKNYVSVGYFLLKKIAKFVGIVAR